MAFPFDGAIYDQIARRDDDLHFWTERVRAASGPVLELGLGTGRLAIPLAREASAYHGIEAEPSMIAALRSNLLAARLPPTAITVHHGSFIDFDLDQQFALVLIPANTIAHVVDYGEAVSFFRAVRRHTSAGGAFIIDTYNPRPLGPSPGRQQFAQYTDPVDDVDVVVYSTPEYDHAAQVVTHRLEYWKTGIQTASRELRQRNYYPAELDAWLRWAGFNRMHHYGTYASDPLAWDSPRLLVAAT